MHLEFPSVADFGLEPAAAVFTRGFADYLVKIAASPAMLLGMARADGVDLAASRVLVIDGAPAGAALIARRGWTCRLAGMCLVPEARRRGAGLALMERLFADTRARGERTMVLEVIEQNDPAVRLYEKCGFAKVRRLVGFNGPAIPEPAPAAAVALEEVDIRELAAAVTRHGLPDLPWQVSAETLAHQGPPALAYRCGGSWVLISDPGVVAPNGPAAPVVAVRALLTEPGFRGHGSAARTLRAVMQRWPGRQWRVSALMPEEMAPAFAEAGFARSALSQWQMTRAVV